MTCVITCGRAASSDAARFRGELAAILAGAMALASVAAGPPADAAGSDARQTGVGEICRAVIGLEPGGAQYQACASSLADSLRSLGRDHAPVQARELTASGSYFYASQRELYRREQLSCTRLGLARADGALAECVADLDGRLFEADNPTQ